MPEVSSKVAIITGAGNGLGRALAMEFFTRGFDLALIDIDSPALWKVKQRCSGTPQLVTIHRVDISNEDEIIAVRREILQKHRRIDVLINNAAVSMSQPFDAMANADFRRLFEVNFWGMVHCTRHFLPDLRKAPRANLANVVSGFALLGFPGKAAYASSKAAVTALTQSLAAELTGTNVRVSLVIPPPLPTNIVLSGPHVSEEKRAAEADFLLQNGMPPESAACIIARQILNGRYRIVVGLRTKFADLATRLFPGMMLKIVGRAKKRFSFVAL